MSLTFSDTKIFKKNDWDLVVSKYKLVNSPKSHVVMPPSDTTYNNVKVYCDRDSWSYFICNIKTAPVQPFDITLLNYIGNVITRYPKYRTVNQAGNLTFDEPTVGLFSEMNIDFEKSSSEEQIILIVPFLKGYSKVTAENRYRLFITDLEAMVKMKCSDEGFFDAIRSKLGKIHLITTSYFSDCPLDTYFGKVSISDGRHPNIEIQKFIENSMGRIISSETTGFSKMVSFNSSADIKWVSNLTNERTTKIIARSGGRLHFSGMNNEEGYFIAIGQNLEILEGSEIGLPFITTGENKIIVKKLIDLVRIISNLPEDIEQKKELMKREMDWVIDWIMNITPYKDTSDIKEEPIQVINYLLQKTYPLLTTFFSNSECATPPLRGRPDKINNLGPQQSVACMGRLSSIF